ncbi:MULTISPECIES: hypothetical protein [Listeria]|uniref:hypothetical protein n=1 Tax=Listeria TaxID=1637 RepID=UPI000B58CDB9|nr:MULTISPECIES: hypothetical protein [Listeria]
MKQTIYINEQTHAKLNQILEEDGFKTIGQFLNHFVAHYETQKETTEKINQLTRMYAGIKRTTDDQRYKMGVVLDVLNTMMQVEDIYECVPVEEEKSAVVEGALMAADKRQEAEKVRAYHIAQTPNVSREEE